MSAAANPLSRAESEGARPTRDAARIQPDGQGGPSRRVQGHLAARLHHSRCDRDMESTSVGRPHALLHRPILPGVGAVPSAARPGVVDARPSSWIDSPTLAGHVVVGVAGAMRNAAAAVWAQGELRSACEEERLTRVRGAALQSGRLPEAALEMVLKLAGRSRSAVEAYVTAERGISLPRSLPHLQLDHHFGHAATAYLGSPFQQAAVIVCDQTTPYVSVWSCRPDGLKNLDWAWEGCGFAQLYSEGAELFGFARGQEHRLEALARLGAGEDAGRLERFFAYTGSGIDVRAGWKAFVEDWIDEDARNTAHRARVASAFQARVGQLLAAFASDVRAQHANLENLCLSGGLYYNTYFNTVLAEAGRLGTTFVPPNPGNPGLAAGLALAAGGAEKDGNGAPPGLSPFLGPAFQADEIKAVLDNCKLSYEYLGEHDVVAETTKALARGLLVGWFQDQMEWGHRALGNRSILASPFSPYVLDNLNVYLKQRERHRTYGLAVCHEDADRLFAGPPTSCYMEHDYRVKEPELFRHVLPMPTATLRVQTVGDSPGLFRRVLKAFGSASGPGVLVNTSFNAFSEPIVCTPRDAVRVFFGTGLDVLVLGRFMVRK